MSEPRDSIRPESFKDLMELAHAFATSFGRKTLGTYAASTTYCMLLSIFPALIIISSLLTYTSLTEADMVEFLLMVFPKASADLVQTICRETYQTSRGVLPVTIVFMLWSASLGVMQLTRGLNVINDVEEKRNYFLLRLIATLYTIIILVLMVAILFLQIFFRQIVDLWQSAFPGAPAPAILTSAARYVVLFVIGVLIFLLLFTTLPAAKKTVSSQLPGALATAFGWEVLSAIFSLYAAYSRNLSIYYGSLTTAIMLMLWIYWCLYILLFGAFLNRFLEQHVLPESPDPR